MVPRNDTLVAFGIIVDFPGTAPGSGVVGMLGTSDGGLEVLVIETNMFPCGAGAITPAPSPWYGIAAPGICPAPGAGTAVPPSAGGWLLTTSSRTGCLVAGAEVPRRAAFFLDADGDAAAGNKGGDVVSNIGGNNG